MYMPALWILLWISYKILLILSLINELGKSLTQVQFDIWVTDMILPFKIIIL